MASLKSINRSFFKLSYSPLTFNASKFISNSALRASSSTVSGTEKQEFELLTRQRLNRPVAPHLSIYRPQITWIASALNRITGVALSGSVYLFGAAYALSPVFGWNITAQSIALAFGALPLAAKTLIKLVISWPFTFHSLNGLRHLSWDCGLQFGKKQVIATGWTVVALSVVSSLYLAFI